MVKKAKRESWEKYCNTLTSDTPICLLWKCIKRLHTPFDQKSQPFITHDAMISDPVLKADALASHYQSVLNSPTPASISEAILLPLALSLSCDDNSSINQPFTLHELENSIYNLKNSSPGLDYIHNKHLANLTLEYKLWLLNIYNDSFYSNTVPMEWKTALIIPIAKPNKPLTNVSSYRPISLLSCVGKLLESLINKRLTFFLEQKKAFRPSQGGFRSRMSAVDQVARLTAAVRDTLNSKGVMVAIFCDFTSAFDTVWHNGILYKLARCGVQGVMLRWLKVYLNDRRFQVFFEGELSSMRRIGSGVPQGAILSPTLFNILMHDIPSISGVKCIEYADDVAFFATDKDIGSATARLQNQLDEFDNWASQWGLSLNINKTKCMYFTHKKVNPPSLLCKGHPIEVVYQFRYLGVTLDAPRLRWGAHIEALKISCIPIVNLLKCISHRQWGADGMLLLKLYKILVLSRLDYAAPFYACAAQTQLSKLSIIQNNCLRTALGCRKTTPIRSLEVEANIPPLSIHRKELLCKYYHRLTMLPMCSIIHDLFCAERQDPYPPISVSLLPSFTALARTTFSEHNLPLPRPLRLPFLSPLPPWFNIQHHILTTFSSTPVSGLTSNTASQTFQDLLQTNFANFTAAYTDGSRVTEPVVSSSAAMVVPSRGVTLNWKLRPEVSVLEAELFALKEALEWAQNNLRHCEKFAIFTDSLSSLYLIKDRKPQSYVHLVFQIQDKLLALVTQHDVKLQFVPGHRGIAGNEAADHAASTAHALRYRTITPMTKEETVRKLHSVFVEDWQQRWVGSTHDSGTGLFLLQIKDKIENWPWASNKNRLVETALARLWLGHAGVRAHMARFRMLDNPMCNCGLHAETIDHLLLHCHLHSLPRTNLTNTLTILKVDLTVKNLLGGGPFPLEVQTNIIKATSDYLTAINALKQM